MSVVFGGDASDEAITTGVWNIPVPREAYTLLMWMRETAQAPADEARYFAMSEGTGGSTAILNLREDNLGDRDLRIQNVFVTAGAQNVNTVNNAYTANAWAFIGARWDNITDDQEVFSGDFAFSANQAISAGDILDNSSAEVAIGALIRLSGSVAREFEGQLEDVMLFNRRLSNAEIRTIFYSRGVSNIVRGLLSRWTLSNRQPNTDVGASQAIDEGPNKKHGSGKIGGSFPAFSGISQANGFRRRAA